MPSPAFQVTLVPTLTVSFSGMKDSSLVVTVSLLEPEVFGELEEPQPATSVRSRATTTREVLLRIFTMGVRFQLGPGLEWPRCSCDCAEPAGRRAPTQHQPRLPARSRCGSCRGTRPARTSRAADRATRSRSSGTPAA